MDLVVSIAIPDDAYGILSVLYKAWLVTYPNPDYGITRDDIEHRFSVCFLPDSLLINQKYIATTEEGSTLLVGKIDGVIVSYCKVLISFHQNQLHALYVAPEYHGNGIGTSMWNIAQQYIDPKKPTIVEVAVYNHRAINFYTRLGFVDTGRRIFNPKFIMKSGSIIPEMEMRRLPVR
jgi:ribosomal protein S18 acetylase RimI-like enzyme